MDIKSGSLAAGIVQFFIIILVAVRALTLDTLWSLIFVICPVVNLFYFFGWVKKDKL